MACATTHRHELGAVLGTAHTRILLGLVQEPLGVHLLTLFCCLKFGHSLLQAYTCTYEYGYESRD